MCCKLDEEGEESVHLPSQVSASVSLRHCGEMHLTEYKPINTDHHHTAEKRFGSTFKMESCASFSSKCYSAHNFQVVAFNEDTSMTNGL